MKSLRELEHRTPENLIDPDEAKLGVPPVVIEVFKGGSIRWPDATIPKGITVIDKPKNNSPTE
ncbi:MAG: hypothetical protein ACPGLY_09390 [Rubripirellula sp.]